MQMRRVVLTTALTLTAVLSCATQITARPTPATRATTDWNAIYASVQEISAIPTEECALRNLYISGTYQIISDRFKLLLGVHQSQVGNQTQANWPTIATWASNSVGVNIRNLTLQMTVAELFAGWPQWFIDAVDELGPDWIDKLPFVEDAFAQMGVGLCGGNRFVFEEVGSKFAQFGQYFASQNAPNQTAWNAYEALFNVSTEADLLAAMEAYYQALYTVDNPRLRAQYIALGNFNVGLQEQTNLQPYIVEAFPANWNITVFGRNISVDLRPVLTRIITLVTAQEFGWVTRDVTVRPIDHKNWPAFLTTLDVPALADIYAELVTDAGGPPVNGGLNGTAAGDWSILAHRMRWIVPFFRSRQDDVTIDCPVLSQANWASMNAGVVPDQSQLCFANCCQQNA